MKSIKYVPLIFGIASLMAVIVACSNGESSNPAEPSIEISGGAPLACIVFEDVEYTFADVRTVNPGQTTTFDVNGTDVGIGDLALVGSTKAGVSRCIDDVSEVYRSNITGDSDSMYTFMPESSTVNPEDGAVLMSPAEWVRWTATYK